MAKFLHSLGVGALVAFTAVSAQAGTIYGSKYGGSSYGIYSLPTEGGVPEKVYNYSALDKIGAVFTPDAFYGVSSNTYSKYCYKLLHGADLGDADAWKTDFRPNDYLKQKDIASALAYNPLTGEVYGSFTNEDATGYNFGIFSQADATSTVIAPLEKQLVSIAADPDGKLFAVDVDGDLCSVSLTGEVTVIGSTGVKPSAKYASGLAFDPETGILYWTPTDTSTDSALYTLDVATGAATKVCDFAYGTNLTALAFNVAAPVEGAPAAAVDFAAVAQGLENVLNVSFTLPSQTVGGEDMLGAVKYKVYLDAEVVADTQGGPGQEVSLVLTPETGSHVVALVLSNAAGKGEMVLANVYVGADSPGAVLDLTDAVDGNKVTLSWSAPVVGEHGGNFDVAALVYDVVCLNDGETVASDLTETTLELEVAAESMAKFKYSVTPKCGELAGPSSETAGVVVGDGMLPPYSQNFNEGSSFDDIYFSAYDANGDGKGWSLYSGWSGGNARYTYSGTNQADDWLFTCPLQLKAGFSYEVSFLLSCGSWGEGEQLEVKYGKLPNVESMTETALASTDYAAGFKGTVLSKVEPAEDGTYYIGIHITSVADSYNVDLDDFEVKAGVESAVKALLADGFAVRALKGQVALNLGAAAAVEIYDLNGRQAFSSKLASGAHAVALPAGLYLVRVDGKTAKVAVR